MLTATELLITIDEKVSRVHQFENGLTVLVGEEIWFSMEIEHDKKEVMGIVTYTKEQFASLWGQFTSKFIDDDPSFLCEEEVEKANELLV